MELIIFQNWRNKSRVKIISLSDMVMNPVCILDTQFKMGGDKYDIIDINWYYGCLLSPRKKGTTHNSVNGNDDYER